MQKQKSFALFALVAVLIALVAFGGMAQSVNAAQATKAATAAVTVAATAAAPIPGSGLVNAPLASEAQKLTGAGATFPQVLYNAWFQEYKKVTGVEVNYQGVGSGGGINAISGQTVDFGATDGPMTDDQLKAAKGGEILHIPMSLGAVVVTYNIPEVKTPLQFTADTIAGIYLGKITKWNDPALVADNASLKAVNQDIIVVHRADSSGTTNIFTSYLAAVNKDWAAGPKFGNSVNWPVGLGGQGNPGVAGVVSQTPYAIGYVELIYALSNKLGYGNVKNKAGKFVVPNLDSVTAAAAAFASTTPDDLRVKIVDAEGDASYPISGYTWQLIYKTQTDAAKATALTRLMWWELHDGQAFSTKLGYAPLPLDIIKRGEAKILSITVNGQPALPSSIATPGAMMAGTMSATMAGTMAATMSATMAATAAK